MVIAAGLGTRMRSATPKHLHPLLGRRLVDWVIEATRRLGPDPLVVVTSPGTEGDFEGVTVAVQREPRGTGDAAAAAQEALSGFDGDVLVVSGDAAAIRSESLERLLETHRTEQAAATVLSFDRERPGDYGRIVRGPGGQLEAIVEAKDASDAELGLTEINSSIYVFEAPKLWPALERLRPENEQGELYLTDTIRDLVAAGERVAVYLDDDDAEVGVNTRAELAATAAVLRGSTKIATNAEIGPHAVVVDSQVGPGAAVGPFCYLRPGTVLEAGAKAGAFVEIKNSLIGERTKVPHQSYIGDAEVGADTNIAAGNVTVNYPHQEGREKGRTKIGRNVRTGVDNAFIAPVEIGDDAWVAAGSVITEDVPPGSLAIARSRQINKDGYADRDDA